MTNRNENERGQERYAQRWDEGGDHERVQNRHWQGQGRGSYAGYGSGGDRDFQSQPRREGPGGYGGQSQYSGSPGGQSDYGGQDDDRYSGQRDYEGRRGQGGYGTSGSQGYGSQDYGSQGNVQHGADYGTQYSEERDWRQQQRGQGSSGYARSGFDRQSGMASRPYERQGYGYGNREAGATLQSNRGRGPKNFTRSDERITEDINEKLSDDDLLDATGLNVEVKQGVVTLTGTVEQRWMKHMAEDIAERCSGVKDVENNIRVSRMEQSGFAGRSSYGQTSATYGRSSDAEVIGGSSGISGSSQTGAERSGTGTSTSGASRSQGSDGGSTRN